MKKETLISIIVGFGKWLICMAILVLASALGASLIFVACG